MDRKACRSCGRGKAPSSHLVFERSRRAPCKVTVHEGSGARPRPTRPVGPRVGMESSATRDLDIRDSYLGSADSLLVLAPGGAQDCTPVVVTLRAFDSYPQPWSQLNHRRQIGTWRSPAR